MFEDPVLCKMYNSSFKINLLFCPSNYLIWSSELWRNKNPADVYSFEDIALFYNKAVCQKTPHWKKELLV